MIWRFTKRLERLNRRDVKALRKAEQAGREVEGALRKLEQAQAALAPITREIADLEVQKVEREKDLAGLITAHDDAAAKLASPI